MEGDVVSQFREVTGSTEELATQYLEIADFDIEQAMQLYFENGGAEIRPTQQPAATASSHHTNNVVSLDSDDEEISIDEARSSAPSRQPVDDSFENDAAMAQRLQEELYAGGDSADNVRAPIARTTETLVGPGADDYGDFDSVLSQFRARRGGRGSQYNNFARNTSGLSALIKFPAHFRSSGYIQSAGFVYLGRRFFRRFTANRSSSRNWRCFGNLVQIRVAS